VAVVLEYRERIKEQKTIPKAQKDNEILRWIDDTINDDIDDDVYASEEIDKEIGIFLEGKSRKQLVEVILDFAKRYPDLRNDIRESTLVNSGNTKALAANIRNEIRRISEEPGWQNYWQGTGYTPDYKGVRRKLEKLLMSSKADEVLSIGKELMTAGIRQVLETDDEGETAREISSCMPVIVKALDQSSLAPVDKLEWALDVVMSDEYNLFFEFADYLERKHAPQDWSVIADRLLERLMTLKSIKGDDSFSSAYRRDLLCNWAIHALEHAGRCEEILPLCISEAPRTGSYPRLVELLIKNRNYEDAERWIFEGIRVTGQKLPGIASNLCEKLLNIHVQQKNWKAVAAIHVENFVCSPSVHLFSECMEIAGKLKIRQEMRDFLLAFLETGTEPCNQKNWPLPSTGLDKPQNRFKKKFPLYDVLFDIAVYEKKPDRVLYWYDHQPGKQDWYNMDYDHIASAIQSYAPERAIGLWQKIAETLIKQSKPQAYEKASEYLGKAAKLMIEQGQTKKWEDYLNNLRKLNSRKRLLIEILDFMAHG
jgi:uncharacterized Zn finger protein